MTLLAATVRTARKGQEGGRGKPSPFVFVRCDYCHQPLKKCRCRCIEGCGG